MWGKSHVYLYPIFGIVLPSLITHVVEELLLGFSSPLVVVLPLDEPFHDPFPPCGSTWEGLMIHCVLNNPHVIMVRGRSGGMMLHLDLGACEQGESSFKAVNTQNFRTAGCSNPVPIRTHDLHDFIGFGPYALKFVKIFFLRFWEVAQPYSVPKLKFGGGKVVLIPGHFPSVDGGELVPYGGPFSDQPIEKVSSHASSSTIDGESPNPIGSRPNSSTGQRPLGGH